MEPPVSQTPNREVVSTPADEATPETHANAMFSPNNVRPGAFKAEAAPNQAEQVATESADTVGGVATGDSVVVDEASVDMPVTTDEFKDLWDASLPEEVNVEQAAVRPNTANNVPGSTSLRSDYWKKPTQEQIDNASGQGADLQKHADKYFS